jgi:DNA-binding NarL/FixJ family response regulator
MSRSVLIVDDHAGFRSWARVLLEMQGYRVVGDVEDGASAVAAVRSLRPDVVLLDVRLPDIDGFEVIRQLAREGIEACVVLVSSRDARDFGDALERSGARGFVAKAELSAAALDAVLARNRERDS